MCILFKLHAYTICETILLYSEDSKGEGGFLTGFLIGGAIFGTLGYVFAPQVLLNLQVFFTGLCTENPHKRRL